MSILAVKLTEKELGMSKTWPGLLVLLFEVRTKF